MRISFGPPVPIGLASRAQYMDVHLKEPLTGEMLARLHDNLPDGMTLLAVQPLVGKTESLFSIVGRALWRATFPDGQAGELVAELRKILAEKSIPYQRFRKVVDIRPLIHNFGRVGDTVYFLLEQSERGSGRPNEYLEISGIPKEMLGRVDICREELLVRAQGGERNPLGSEVELPFPTT